MGGSTVFGFLHTGNGGENWIGIFGAGFIGFVFCVSVRLTGSAWWAIGCHASWDWAETFFFGTADSGFRGQGHYLTANAAGNPFWSGGTDGPEGSLLVVGVLLLLLLFLVVVYRRGPGRERRFSKLFRLAKTQSHHPIAPSAQDGNCPVSQNSGFAPSAVILVLTSSERLPDSPSTSPRSRTSRASPPPLCPLAAHPSLVFRCLLVCSRSPRRSVLWLRSAAQSRSAPTRRRHASRRAFRARRRAPRRPRRTPHRRRHSGRPVRRPGLRHRAGPPLADGRPPPRRQRRARRDHGPSLLDHDKAQRVLQIRLIAQRVYEHLSAADRRRLDDYARGVNLFIAQCESSHTLPAEFRLLMYKPQPWTGVDSLSVGMMLVQTLDPRSRPSSPAPTSPPGSMTRSSRPTSIRSALGATIRPRASKWT